MGRRLLPNVEHIRIPRCYSGLVSKKDVEIQLHIFVDASEDAMAAVAYLRFCDGCSTECVIVGAKSKVAPLHPMSIPRMELQAALIGSRMAKTLSESHKFVFEKRVLWTDSRNVLHWLRSDAKQYKQFVMFRVAEIQENTERDEWRWVPTKLNVTDEATKWAKLPNFDENSRWLKGPSFLYENDDKWPNEKFTEPENLLKQEIKPKYLLVLDNIHLDDSPLTDPNRFSNWEHLHRSLAFVVRFVENCRRKTKELPLVLGFLRSEELRSAEIIIFKMVQKMEYEDDLVLLRKGKKLPKSSQLFKCSTYFNEDGILCMKGRIDYAEFVEESIRRPILLPRRSRVSFLILDFYHRKFKHSCTETMINEARKRFYIPGLRSLPNSVRIKCSSCILRMASPRCPEMAQLPKARLGAFYRPFTFVGVDYFGPIAVTVGRSSVKRWGVLFTCLTVRAIHIEVAHSLTTDSCILCIRNFMARRGTPSEIYSDNGTNFVGADKELKEAFKSINLKGIAEKFTTAQLKWFFNPPAAPHMGGSWERLIGSVKKVLKEVVQNQRLTDETLLSTLIEIEGIINSRPLTTIPIDNESEEALTPNHFLLGTSDGSRLPGEFQSQDLLSRKSWRRCQQISNIFWKRWVREYLPTLTKRTKWFERVKPIKVGDVVIIVDENLPRYSWPKGIVVQTIASKDGQVRRASERTANGIYDRPAVRLAILDVDNNINSEESESCY